MNPLCGPRRRAVQRRARSAVTPVLLVFLLPFCATIDRGHDRTVVSADIEYARAGHRTFGCGGGVTGEQRHHQLGVRSAVRHEWLEGPVLGGGASVVAGSLSEERGLDSDRFGRYLLVNLGLLAGGDFEGSGFHLGGRGVLSSRGGRLFLPDISFWFGQWDDARLELGSGSFDGPHDTKLFFMGVGWRDPSDGTSAGLGAAFFGRPLVDAETGKLELGRWGEGSDVGGYGYLTIALWEGGRLDLGVVASLFPSGRVGVSFDL